MQKNNHIFNDTYFCTRILIDSTRLRDTLEKNRDIEIESTEDESEKQQIQLNYKSKLQSIYRIRNNAFSFLLYNGFQCSYDVNEENEKTFYMTIENTIYDGKESAIKSILGKDFNKITEKCLSKKEFEKAKIEEIQVPTPTSTKSKSESKQELSDEEVDELLNLFMGDADSKPSTNKNNNIEENKSIKIAEKNEPEIIEEKVPVKPVSEVLKEEVTLPKKKEDEEKIQCPNCLHQNPIGVTVCELCGNDLLQTKSTKKVTTREELRKKDNTDNLSDEEIDKMFEELEKRLSGELAKKKETDIFNNVASNTSSTPASTSNKKSFDEDETTIKQYDPSESVPSIDKEDLIVDIYTLKMKDPKIESDEETKEETHKRQRVGETIKEFNSIEDEEDEVIRDIKIHVYPLYVPDNGTELSSDVLVYIEQDGRAGLFCSSMTGIKTVRVDTNIHSFIVRGSWKDGVFESRVILSGNSIAGNCEINRNIEKIRPSENELQLGHTTTLLSVEYVDGTESMRIHAMPLSDKNDEDGLTKAIYLMENFSQGERKLYATKASNYISFDFEEEIYKVSSKWDDDVFKTKVENY